MASLKKGGRRMVQGAMVGCSERDEGLTTAGLRSGTNNQLSE